jgi:adenylate cyclase
MGDNVNLASRLEGVNKLYGTKIIVSRETQETVTESFWLRPLAIVAVKGKSEGTTIYELVGRKVAGETRGAEAELCEGFARGFRAYLSRDWEGAYEIFTNLSLRFPGDGPTAFYLARCETYQDSPPGPDWKGVEYLEVK